MFYSNRSIVPLLDSIQNFTYINLTDCQLITCFNLREELRENEWMCQGYNYYGMRSSGVEHKHFILGPTTISRVIWLGIWIIWLYNYDWASQLHFVKWFTLRTTVVCVIKVSKLYHHRIVICVLDIENSHMKLKFTFCIKSSFNLQNFYIHLSFDGTQAQGCCYF